MPEFTPEAGKQYGPLLLIARFFNLTTKEAAEQNRNLTEKDRIELGSAIAREYKLLDSQLKFVPVPY
jgi:hypothetical protein